jgi:glycolate oxidase iron-sulfur subunit
MADKPPFKPPLERLKECILCGRCLEVCPLVTATGREELSPKAKQALAKALRVPSESGEALASKPAAALAGLCLGCDRCRAACSQGLSAYDTMASLRAAHPDFQSWLWKLWVTRSDELWPAFAGLAGILRAVPAGEGAESGATAEASWKRWTRALTALSGARRPEAWLRVARFDATAAQGRRVALFPGCLARTLRKDWTEKARRILLGLGAELLPNLDFGCCGQTLEGAGQLDAAREARSRNLAVWREAGRPQLVTFCATCAHGLGRYPFPLAGEQNALDWGAGGVSSESEQWSSSLVSLASLWGETGFAFEQTAPARVLFHRPCHRQTPDADFLWLRTLLGARLARWTEQECCGLAGVMQLAAPALSAQVGARCLERLAPQPGDTLLTSCSGCVTQLAAVAPAGVKVGHWLDVVDL